MTINYTEKGEGMHIALAKAGLSLYQQDGVWQSHHPESQVQAFIDTYQPDPLEQLPAINERCEKLLSEIKQSYPKSEVDSWPKQEAEAVAGGGPLTSSLALARGIPLELLLEKILLKSEAYAQISGQIIGTRQALEDRIMAGELNVTWPESM